MYICLNCKIFFQNCRCCRLSYRNSYNSFYLSRKYGRGGGVLGRWCPYVWSLFIINASSRKRVSILQNLPTHLTPNPLQLALRNLPLILHMEDKEIMDSLLVLTNVNQLHCLGFTKSENKSRNTPIKLFQFYIFSL